MSNELQEKMSEDKKPDVEIDEEGTIKRPARGLYPPAEERMEDNEVIYLPETLISPYTHRPLFKCTATRAPTFWCELCKYKLVSPKTAILHLSGKHHQKKLAAQHAVLPTSSTTVPKSEELRPATSNEPLAKRPRYDDVGQDSKPATAAKSAVKSAAGRCERCNIDFTSDIHAEQHYNGKKHAALLAEVTAGKEVQNMVGSKMSSDENKNGDVEKKPLQCELCDIQFTSDIHALQHFKGRKHSEALAAQYNKRMEENGRSGGAIGRGGASVSGGRGTSRGGGASTGRGSDRGRGGGMNNISRGGSGSAGGSQRGRGGGMNSNSRGRGIGRGETNTRGRGRGTTTQSRPSTEPVYDSFYASKSNGYSNQNSNQNSGSYDRYYAPTSGNYNSSGVSDSTSAGYSNAGFNNTGFSDVSTYTNKMSEINSDINQLKRRLGSLYNQ